MEWQQAVFSQRRLGGERKRHGLRSSRSQQEASGSEAGLQVRAQEDGPQGLPEVPPQQALNGADHALQIRQAETQGWSSRVPEEAALAASQRWSRRSSPVPQERELRPDVRPSLTPNRSQEKHHEEDRSLFEEVQGPRQARAEQVHEALHAPRSPVVPPKFRSEQRPRGQQSSN